MKHISTDSISLIEDHHEAYFLWRERGFRGKTLIHVDAHIDFRFFSLNPSLPQTISEAKTKTDLIRRLEKHIAFAGQNSNHDKKITLANYVYPAMRDGIVETFYWVMPGDSLDEARDALESVYRGLAAKDPYETGRFERQGECVRMTLYGKDFYACSLKGLPRVAEGALLDIDVDFLVMPSVKINSPIQEIGQRKPWISPGELASVLKKKVPAPLYTTIAYSVNHGYTPIVYKTLGDRIYLGFTGSEGRSLVAHKLQAHEYFMRSMKLYDKKRHEAAREAYQKAVACDPSYGAPDNNLGPLFLANRQYDLAEEEFNKMLVLDPQNACALRGLGKIAKAAVIRSR